MQFCKTYNLANGKVIGTFAILLGMALFSSMPVRAAEGDALTTNAELPAITMIPGDGMNLEIEEVLNQYYVIVKLTSPAHNWFAGTFTNLPTDKVVTIGLSMEGNDTLVNKADVTKWRGLMPVITYADPIKYETYEWYQKDDQDRWVSGDPFKQGEAKYAGTGKVPEQSVIPKDVSEQFLSTDGKYWQPWREVDNAEVVPGINVLRITHRFLAPTATIAMRVPYTYSYLQAYLQRLQAANIPGVSTDAIGVTAEDRNLTVIRIEDSKTITPLQIDAVRKDPTERITRVVQITDLDEPERKNKPNVFVVFAREHATEHASSWVVDGVLRELIGTQGEKRGKQIWLIVPIEDPDGSAHSAFDWLTTHFFVHSNDGYYGNYTPTEVIDYIRYFRAFVNSGRLITVATTFHNIECNEGPIIFSPWALAPDKGITTAFNKYWFGELRKDAYMVGSEQPQQVGIINGRLYGYCWDKYGSLGLGFEVNDRLPAQRQSLAETQRIGASYAEAISQFMNSDEGKERVLKTQKFIELREQHRKEFLTRQPSTDQMGMFLHCWVRILNTIGRYQL